MEEPQVGRKFERASFFIQPVCAAGAKQGRSAAPENGRSMAASLKKIFKLFINAVSRACRDMHGDKNAAAVRQEQGMEEIHND